MHYTIPGPSFVQGATCELGLFAPISEDEAKVLMAAGDEEHKSRRRGNRDTVKTEAVAPAAPKRPADK